MFNSCLSWSGDKRCCCEADSNTNYLRAIGEGGYLWCQAFSPHSPTDPIRSYPIIDQYYYANQYQPIKSKSSRCQIQSAHIFGRMGQSSAVTICPTLLAILFTKLLDDCLKHLLLPEFVWEQGTLRFSCSLFVIFYSYLVYVQSMEYSLQCLLSCCHKH